MKTTAFTFAIAIVAAFAFTGNASATVSPTWTMGFPWKTVAVKDALR